MFVVSIHQPYVRQFGDLLAGDIGHDLRARSVAPRQTPSGPFPR
jgi:hypothetical protein